MSTPRREYFYEVDLRGRLWHAGTELGDPQFLDSFFRRLRPNETGRHAGFGYVSLCAGEWNFVKAADRPIVFHSLTPADDLVYAGSLCLPFRPAALRVSAAGRLYHPAPVGGLGLLSSALVLSLMDALESVAEGEVLRWRGSEFPLRRLSPEAGRENR